MSHKVVEFCSFSLKSYKHINFHLNITFRKFGVNISFCFNFTAKRLKLDDLFCILLRQSGPKVLDHWSVITSDFPRSPFSMLIHIKLARTPLLSTTLKQGVGRGNCIWIQELGAMIPSENRQKINVSAVNGWMKLKRERRSNDFWLW